MLNFTEYFFLGLSSSSKEVFLSFANWRQHKYELDTKTPLENK
jgi:hypothetical protein